MRERGLGRFGRLVAGDAGALRGEAFAVAMLDRCLERLQDPFFAEQLWTDRLSVAQVSEQIAAMVGLALAPDRGTALQGRLRRTWISLRHIRLD